MNKKPSKFDFDLLVIGSGAAGGVGAHLAVGYGKRVGLVEFDKLGGDCPNYSCIPTKALLSAATTLKAIQSAPQYGLRASGASFNPTSLHAWKQKAVKEATGEHTGKTYTSEGIAVLRGHAHFLSPWTISVGSHRYTARKFLIASGSSAVTPNIAGLNETGYITYREAADLTKFPKSIAIIGGGAVAYEYGQIFSAFGVKTYVIEQHNHLFSKEDVEVGDIAEANLVNAGVRVLTSSKVTKVSGDAKRKVVVFEQHGQQHRILAEQIMIANGKLPNVDLGLENTGIRYDEYGVKVNANMQTSKEHIYAAGDVTGGQLFTHVAVQEARVALHNMFQRGKIKVQNHAIPRVFYGNPEIAAVGKTEHELIMCGHLYQTSIAPIGILGRSTATNYTSGFVKVIATHNGVLIGASVVAPHAGEILQELTFAIQHRKRAHDVAETMHAFPTWSEAVRIACSKIRCI